jgi:hypothetical protein
MTGANGDEPGASAAAVAGLASEVEALRRLVTPLADRVDDLARVTAEVADRVRSQGVRAGPRAVPSWLVMAADPALAHALLDELYTWTRTVFLRYTDADQVLPECWLWHPELVEELLWLMHAWLAAYQGESASVALVGDWHDRYRPGVVRRIGSLTPCSLEVHLPTHEDRTYRKRRPDAVDRIARWWTTARESRAPEPSASDMVEPPRGRP